MNLDFNDLLQKIKKNKSLLLLILVIFILRTAYGLCINFSETNTQYLQDYTQIYLLGLKFYTTGIWPYWGPDITYTASQIPGALQGLLVGLPFFIVELPEAPFVLLNILSALSLVFFGWYISRRISGIPKWFIYAWLLTAPWTVNYSTTIINPSYLLAPSILFFVSIIELLPIYERKIFSVNLSFFFIGISLGWILQLHMSWVLLPFYILISFIFLLFEKNYKTIFTGLLSLGIGFCLAISTLIPTFIKYGFLTGNAESAIIFNASNFKNIDVITRFIAFSTFDARQFIAGGFQGQKQLLLNNVWASPLIIILFTTGILQTIYYLFFFFRKISRPEFKYVKLFTIGSMLLIYVSYLFAARDLASYTFYLLLPVSFWFSFYCLENIFRKPAWKKIGVFFLLSGLIYHVVLAKEYYPTNSLYSKRNLIVQALKNKNSKLFAQRRTAKWEILEREKVWQKKLLVNSGDTVISFLNDFDKFDPSILPESASSAYFVSKPFSCQVDSLNPFSPALSAPLKEIRHQKKISVSFYKRFSELNDGLLVVSITRNDQPLFWSGDKICQDSASLNKWTLFSVKKEIPAINDPAAKIGVYVWMPARKSKSEIQIDDFKVDFQ